MKIAYIISYTILTGLLFLIFTWIIPKKEIEIDEPQSCFIHPYIKPYDVLTFERTEDSITAVYLNSIPFSRTLFSYDPISQSYYAWNYGQWIHIANLNVEYKEIVSVFLPDFPSASEDIDGEEARYSVDYDAVNYSTIFRIGDRFTVYGRNLPKGTILLDINTDRLYYADKPLQATESISNSYMKLKPIVKYE